MTEYSVKLVSGEDTTVLSESEVRWFNATRNTYLDQTKFTDTTDLRDLDRLLILELMIFRWGQWLSRGTDYDNFDFDDAALRRNMRDYSEQVTKLKDSMGLSKKARDEAASEGDLSTYLTNLKQRAKAFGVHRVRQTTQALTLMNDLSAIIGAFDRSDEEERAKLGFTSEVEIVEWIRESMLPEFSKIDEYFRTNEQRYWIREM